MRINQESNTEEILFGLLKGNPGTTGIVDLFNNSKDFPNELIDKLSLETALKYWTGQISYKDGDTIMNNIIGCMRNEIPAIAWECYLAFDAGEFYRPGDEKTVEPAEKYTKPLIEELLKKRNLIP